VPPQPATDKGTIKAALGRGEFVPGCRLAQTMRYTVTRSKSFNHSLKDFDLVTV
jgi:hypothetical protein